MGLHCHAQIEYTAVTKVCDEFQNDQVETLTGFNPTVESDRKFLHLLLDEYLDYLAIRFNEAKSQGQESFEPLYEENGFKVFDCADTH